MTKDEMQIEMMKDYFGFTVIDTSKWEEEDRNKIQFYKDHTDPCGDYDQFMKAYIDYIFHCLDVSKEDQKKIEKEFWIDEDACDWSESGKNRFKH